MSENKTIEQKLDEKYEKDRKDIIRRHTDPLGKTIPGHEEMLKEELTALDYKFDSRIKHKIEKRQFEAKFGIVERD